MMEPDGLECLDMPLSAECFLSDKAKIVSVLNGFKNNPFYPI